MSESNVEVKPEPFDEEQYKAMLEQRMMYCQQQVFHNTLLYHLHALRSVLGEIDIKLSKFESGEEIKPETPQVDTKMMNYLNHQQQVFQQMLMQQFNAIGIIDQKVNRMISKTDVKKEE